MIVTEILSSRGYLKRAFARVRELGGLCVSDEVQTGFGRTGDHYWGFEVQYSLEDSRTTHNYSVHSAPGVQNMKAMKVIYCAYTEH
jgi:hypothetical protein